MHRGPGAGSVSQAAAEYGRERGINVIDGGCPCMFDPTADRGHKAMRPHLHPHRQRPERSDPRRSRRCCAQGLEIAAGRSGHPILAWQGGWPQDPTRRSEHLPHRAVVEDDTIAHARKRKSIGGGDSPSIPPATRNEVDTADDCERGDIDQEPSARGSGASAHGHVAARFLVEQSSAVVRAEEVADPPAARPRLRDRDRRPSGGPDPPPAVCSPGRDSARDTPRSAQRDS